MKRAVFLLLTTIILAACGGDAANTNKKAAELAKLKKERAALDEKIAKLEAEVNKNDTTKASPVSVMALTPQDFTAYIEVQSQITGDENVLATPQAMGTVTSVLVHAGQKVSKGQTLALLDAAVIEQQIKALEPQLTLQKSLYDRQQKLWAQNIGTEVQLMSAKAQYEATAKQKAALQAQRNMYSIKSPISGTVDRVDLKPGDVASPGMSGIRVVSMDKLKAEANLGENYLGQVDQGDATILVFPDLNDSIKTKLSYVARAIDPISRTFLVQVRLGSNNKLHPNMSCRMKIANYHNDNAIVVPVSAVQKTATGNLVYVANGNKAKAVNVELGRTYNGNTEILSGLNAGDKLITQGYEELDNGENIKIQ